MTIPRKEAVKILHNNHQEHVLRFWDTLDQRKRKAILSQVDALDFGAISEMRRLLSCRKESPEAKSIEPAGPVQLTPAGKEAARAAGEEVLRDGRVGVILVAGGQGTRLGFDGPKGCFPLGPVSGASLFEIHARKILALEKRYGAPTPFYIMTSEANDRATRDFFAANDWFGLKKESVEFFVQGAYPALWPDGRLVLDAPDHIFVAPDGHGGVLTALKRTGMLDDMKKRGVATLFYFQVDNPLVEIAEPVFIGHHVLKNAEMSVKVCAKRDAGEGLGVVVKREGRLAVVEYTELTPDQKNAVDRAGELVFKWGSVAIHVFSRDFLKKMADARLPLHLAHKKVPFCDDNGSAIVPDKPNARKFEQFVFDALPMAERCVVFPFAREDEFSPVKNGSGADSPETARKDMMLKWARWMEQCGVKPPGNQSGGLLWKIEIDPVYALTAEDLRARLPPDFSIQGDVLLNPHFSPRSFGVRNAG